MWKPLMIRLCLTLIEQEVGLPHPPLTPADVRAASGGSPSVRGVMVAIQQGNQSSFCSVSLPKPLLQRQNGRYPCYLPMRRVCSGWRDGVERMGSAVPGRTGIGWSNASGVSNNPICSGNRGHSGVIRATLQNPPNTGDDRRYVLSHQGGAGIAGNLVSEQPRAGSRSSIRQ